MAFGLLSGVSNTLVSKVAIGAIVVAGLGGAAAKFIPPPSQDVAIWFDQPISKQHLTKGPNNLLLHVGRGQIATTVRVDVMTLNGGAGPTLTTDAIQTQKHDPYAKVPSEPENLQFAVVGWDAVPGTYKLIPSFTSGGGWTKGHTITVTVDGEPKPGDTGGSALPVPDDAVTPDPLDPLDPDADGLPTDEPTVDPGDLDPGDPTPEPTTTLPPPPPPVIPPSGTATQWQSSSGPGNWDYTFQGSAITPKTAKVTFWVKRHDTDFYGAVPCGPMSDDDVAPQKGQCKVRWTSPGANGYQVAIDYFMTVESGGSEYRTPTKTFLAGKGIG